MDFPDGYQEYIYERRKAIEKAAEYCVLLTKALYGLVQAARQWWKKITETFKKIGFYPSEADPCLFGKKKNGDEPPAFFYMWMMAE